jgi:hypothetical protein
MIQVAKAAVAAKLKKKSSGKEAQEV